MQTGNHNGLLFAEVKSSQEVIRITKLFTTCLVVLALFALVGSMTLTSGCASKSDDSNVYYYKDMQGPAVEELAFLGNVKEVQDFERYGKWGRGNGGPSYGGGYTVQLDDGTFVNFYNGDAPCCNCRTILIANSTQGRDIMPKKNYEWTARRYWGDDWLLINVKEIT